MDRTIWIFSVAMCLTFCSAEGSSLETQNDRLRPTCFTLMGWNFFRFIYGHFFGLFKRKIDFILEIYKNTNCFNKYINK